MLLVGCGSMAVAHAHVLAELGCNLVVAGRGENSAATFARETGVQPTTGGVDRVLESLQAVPDIAVVAVPIPALAATTTALIEAGVVRVLVEKPAGLTREDVARVAAQARRSGTTVLVAYNRRFYASVRCARELIDEDGGVSSFTFEFTELRHRVEETQSAESVKSNWFLANSTHVVDLAFFLGGEPTEINACTGGSLPWHTPARFAGSGITTHGSPFSYFADWTGPGRWGMEIVTKRRRLVLRPLEELRVQEHGEMVAARVDLGTDLDVRFKPGLLAQARAFLEDDRSDFIDIFAHLQRIDRVYLPMLEGRK